MILKIRTTIQAATAATRVRPITRAETLAATQVLALVAIAARVLVTRLRAGPARLLAEALVNKAHDTGPDPAEQFRTLN